MGKSERPKAFEIISLVVGLLGIIDFITRHLGLGDTFTLADIGQILLLIILCALVIFELDIFERKKGESYFWIKTNKKGEPYFRIKTKYAIPLLLVATGISIIGKSSAEIQNTILGGMLNLVLFFIVDRLSRLFLRHWGIDQATIIAGYLGGLMIGYEKGFALIFLTSLLAVIIWYPYMAFQYYKRGYVPSGRCVPFLPFLVIAAVFMQTPYYDKVDLYIHNKGNERCIDMIVESLKQGTLHMNLKDNNVPVSISVVYGGNPSKSNSLDMLKAQYQKQDPVVKYLFWRSLIRNMQAKTGFKDYKVFRDITTGAYITVRPLYYLARVSYL